MKHAPKVSVIVPMYNEEKYIEATLISLFKQTYNNYEIIVVNNTSTDNSIVVAQKTMDIYNTQNIPVVLIEEPQKGTNHARETARRFATGDIIAQTDADCIVPPNWIQKGVDCLSKHPIVAVSGPYWYFDSSIWLKYFAFITQIVTYPFMNWYVQLIKKGAICIGGNTFIKAAVLNQAGGYNRNLTFYGDDVEVAARVAKFGWIHFVPNLIVATSSRRYNALGFWKVNKKYQQCFFKLLQQQTIASVDSLEVLHPR